MKAVTAYYGRGCKGLTIGLSLAAGVLVFAVFRDGGFSDAAMLLAIFAPMLSLMAVEFWFVRVELTETEVRCFSPFRASRSVPISNITHIDFATMPQWFRIHTRDYGIVRLHGYLTGLYDVLNELETVGHPFPRVKHVRKPFHRLWPPSARR